MSGLQPETGVSMDFIMLIGLACIFIFAVACKYGIGGK
jgi:hypothetical protein